MYKVNCDCGFSIQVNAAKAGNSVVCSKCNSRVSVPTLSQLKRKAGETVSLLSVAEQVAKAVAEKQPPFHGKCQVCETKRAASVLPTTIRYLERRDVYGAPVKVSPSGLGVGYAQSEEHWIDVGIPCQFCESCGNAFRQNRRKARRSATASKFLKSLLLVPVAIVAVFLMALLPFVALSLAAFIVFAIYRQATRKRADPFLTSHLRKLAGVEKLLEEDEYVLKSGDFVAIEGTSAS